MTLEESNVCKWSLVEVAAWLRLNRFDEYVDLLCNVHKIDGTALLCLTEDDLRKPPLQLNVVGDIKRIGLALKHLQARNPDIVHPLNFKSSSLLDSNGFTSHYLRRSTSEGVQSGNDLRLMSDNGNMRSSQSFPPEYGKLLLSFVYMFLVFILTAFVMVIVHDRVPNMDKYPPLPDLALDNIPLIPWAFEMCELTALILAVLFWCLMFFHKHRFIIMRRMCSLTGTVFLLRCVCMLITSLSVPGAHLKCQPQIYGELDVRMRRTVEIFLGFGMSMQGVRTCGDYMFSGHTVVVTMLNFFVSEYTPSSLHIVHTFAWILNIFGVFFILAAHEHYSIDVFIAFYITSRLFLYYHSLANNHALTQPDRRRMHIWFPMFSYFEANVAGIVPNEYEWPLPWPSKVLAKKTLSSKAKDQ